MPREDALWRARRTWLRTFDMEGTEGIVSAARHFVNILILISHVATL